MGIWVRFTGKIINRGYIIYLVLILINIGITALNLYLNWFLINILNAATLVFKFFYKLIEVKIYKLTIIGKIYF